MKATMTEKLKKGVSPSLILQFLCGHYMWGEKGFRVATCGQHSQWLRNEKGVIHMKKYKPKGTKPYTECLCHEEGKGVGAQPL